MYARQEMPDDDDLYLNEPEEDSYALDDDERDAGYFADSELQKLADVLNFTPDELAMNWAGYLTERQMRQLEHDLRQMYWIIIGLLSFTAFGLGALALVHFALLFIPVGLMIAAAVVAFIYRNEREHLPDRDVDWSRVKVGWFSLITKGIFGDDSHQTAYFNDNKLVAPRAVYRAMQPNLHYRVYFVRTRLPSGYRVLSMEPESGPKPKRAKPKRS